MDRKNLQQNNYKNYTLNLLIVILLFQLKIHSIKMIGKVMQV